MAEEIKDALREARRTGKLLDLRSSDTVVPAEVLADLLTRPDDEQLRSRTLRLTGARITGPLDLEGAELVCSTELSACRFEEQVMLREATALTLRLLGCEVPAFQANHLTTHGNLELAKGFTSKGHMSLVGAHIGGQLNCSGAKLNNSGGYALLADGLVVDEGMFCRDGFIANGEVHLVAARIGTYLELDGATFNNPKGVAFYADGLKVEQSMFCRDGFTARGEVRLIGAQIGGNFSLLGARLEKPGGSALTADGLTVGRNILCRRPESPRMKGRPFTARGELRLAGAHVGGNLEMDGASLDNAERTALHAEGLIADHNVFLRSGFASRGTVNLRGARIDGALSLKGAKLSDPPGTALDLYGRKAATLLLLPAAPPDEIRLTHADVDVFADSPATRTTARYLQGFRYDTLDENPIVRVSERLEWIRGQSGNYSPEPYEQLIAVYHRAGREEDARRVAIAKQQDRRSQLNWLGKVWSYVLGGLVGHGYRTWLAGAWLMGFVLVGWFIFDFAHPKYLVTIKPLDQRPSFHAGAYALDLLLPFVNLGYQDTWIIHGRWVLVCVLLWHLVGWVLTSVVVATVAGMLKRR